MKLTSIKGHYQESRLLAPMYSKSTRFHRHLVSSKQDAVYRIRYGVDWIRPFFSTKKDFKMNTIIENLKMLKRVDIFNIFVLSIFKTVSSNKQDIILNRYCVK